MWGLGAGVVAVVLGAAPAMAMTIYVDPPSASRITLDAEPSDSTENIRAKVQDAYGIPPEDQTLLYRGIILEDGRTLSDYNIQANSILQLQLQLPVVSSSMLIHVLTPFGRTFDLAVEASDSVESLRVELESRSGTPTSMQILTLGPTTLRDGRTLADYNVHAGDTIELSLPAPVWLDATLELPLLGVAYSDSVAASGFQRVYSVVSGALPAGLALDPQSGVVAGTPTDSGTARFTIRASAVSGSIDQAFTMDVAEVDTGSPGPESPSADKTQASSPVPAHLAETGAAADLGAPLTLMLLVAGSIATAADAIRRRRDPQPAHQLRTGRRPRA
jgi:hypothetical protein